MEDVMASGGSKLSLKTSTARYARALYRLWFTGCRPFVAAHSQLGDEFKERAECAFVR